MVTKRSRLTDKGWAARLSRADGTTAGAGFLVDDQHVVTCAHAIADVLGLAAEANEPDENTPALALDFTDVDVETSATIVPDSWVPRDVRGGGDLVALRLTTTSEHLQPVHLSKTTLGLGQRVFLNGYPAGRPQGSHAFARTAGPTGPRRSLVMLESEGAAYRITRGFSGAAVWDADGAHVVGMLTSVEGTTALPGASMLPVDAMTAMWRPLAECVDPDEDLDVGLQRSREVAERISVTVQYPDEDVRRIDQLGNDERHWVVYLNNTGDAPAHSVVVTVGGPDDEDYVDIPFPALEPNRRQWYILRPHEYAFTSDEPPAAIVTFTVFSKRWLLDDGLLTFLPE
jgi:hypothetical protein